MQGRDPCAYMCDVPISASSWLQFNNEREQWFLQSDLDVKAGGAQIGQLQINILGVEVGKTL